MIESEIPDVLFHYTTQAGLLGILSTDSLWATKIHYLNDAAEFQLAIDLARDFLMLMLSKQPIRKEEAKINALLDNLRQIERLNICIISLSTHGDLLSQWRAYSGGSGFSIGLRTQQIKEQCAEQNFYLARCVYDPSAHRELIEQLIVESLAVDFNTQSSTIDPDRPRTLVALPTGGDFKRNFARLAPTLKNRAFHEEAEWRLISSTGIDVKRMSFRPSQSMLIPYVPFHLGVTQACCLDSIILGPTPHPILAKESVRSLLGKMGLAQNVAVRTSEAPYRAW